MCIKTIKTRLIQALCLLPLIFVLTSTMAFAESHIADKSAAETIIGQDNFKTTMSTMLNIQGAINTFIWPLLLFTGGLLDNSLLFANGMENHLRDIWILIRNLVNILFVIALVGIALYNVLGIGEEGGNYSIKAILPKLVIGIIAVNFSFLGIKVFLDAINVLTIAIFSMPDQVDEGLSTILSFENDGDKEIVERFCLLSQGKSISELTKMGEDVEKKKTFIKTIKTEGGIFIARNALLASGWRGDYKVIDANVLNSDGSVNVDKLLAQVNTGSDKINKESLADTVKRLEKGRICNGLSLSEFGGEILGKYEARSAPLAFVLNMSNIVFYEQLDLSVENGEKILYNIIFSALLYIVYLASFVALAVVLVARLVVLWLAIALSPILLLGLAVPAFKEKLSGFGEITDKFVQNALAPVGIALSMTIGWIMLKAIQSLNGFENDSSLNATIGLPVVGLSTLKNLIVAFGVIAVVWLGVFTAASKSIAEGVTNAIRGGLQKAGSWMVLTPLKNAPFIPIRVPGTEKTDQYSLGQLAYLPRAIEYKSQENISKLASDLEITGTGPGEIAKWSTPEFLNQLATRPDQFEDNGRYDRLMEYIRENRPSLNTAMTEDGLRKLEDKLKGAKDDPKKRTEILRDAQADLQQAAQRAKEKEPAPAGSQGTNPPANGTTPIPGTVMLSDNTTVNIAPIQPHLSKIAAGNMSQDDKTTLEGALKEIDRASGNKLIKNGKVTLEDLTKILADKTNDYLGNYGDTQEEQLNSLNKALAPPAPGTTP